MSASPFPRIVVPLDGSAASKAALGPAIEVAAIADVPMVLLRVVGDDDAVAPARTELEEVATALPSDRVAEVVVLVATRDLLPVTIVGEAARDQALICLATHGRSGIEQSVLGSVAAEALRLCANPILLAGPNLDPEHGIAGGPLVACLDGSTFGEAVLPGATSWSRAFDLELRLANVADPADDETDATAYLGAVAGRIDEVAACEVLPGPDVASNLVQLARDQGAGLLALATHGRSGSRQAVLGSVAMSVVRAAPCPVLVARSRTLTDGG